MIHISADYEYRTRYTIRVRTNDGTGGIYEEALIIFILDVADTASPMIVTPYG